MPNQKHTLQNFVVPEKKRFKLSEVDADFTGDFADKEAALADLEKSRAKIETLQNVLYAENTRALLIVIQAMDAAGKDSLIKHVFSGVNPQGVDVVPFKPPTADEYAHDFLWRAAKALPSRGKIGIFTRSYYEEVLVVRVYPEILANQPLPDDIKRSKKIWDERLADIRNYESYLTRNGIAILKFFLHVSPDEQKKQLLERTEDAEKHWKFSFGDLKDRQHWDDYMRAYEKAFQATSTKDAAWHVVPANKRWMARATVARIIADKLESMNLKYPEVTEKQKAEIAEAKRILENEKNDAK